MGAGRDYEMHLVNGLSETTSDDVWVTRQDYSGNSKHAFTDVAMVWEENEEIRGAFVEAKKRQADGGNRATVMAGSAKEQNGLGELEELIEQTPSWGEAWIAVKFTHRELILVNAVWLVCTLNDSKIQEDVRNEEEWVDRQTGMPRLTDGGNVSMRKPTLDEHNSAVSGKDDVEKILDTVT